MLERVQLPMVASSVSPPRMLSHPASHTRACRTSMSCLVLGSWSDAECAGLLTASLCQAVALERALQFAQG